MIHTDVIIVGGGPAGASCAWRLMKENINCIILDKQRFPRPKTCAGWITPEVLQDLDLNILDYPYGLAAFTSFSISLLNIKFKLKVDQYAIRRIEFDDWLLRRSGVPCKLQHVKKITRTGDQYIIDGLYSSKYLVGAGGTHCPVYRTFFSGISPRAEESLIVAMEEEFPYTYTDDQCRLWFLEDHLPGYAWYVPKANGYINIGIGAKIVKMRSRRDTIKGYWDHFVEKLGKSGLVTGHSFKPNGHSYYLRQKHPQIRMGDALIVGDAVGLATLDMGEGIRSAVKSGMLAAEAIIHETDYSVASLPKYSLFSLLNLRSRKKFSREA